MNIGNRGYSSWIHNTAPRAGYGNGSRMAGNATNKAFPMVNKKSDTDVIKDAGADTEIKDAGEKNEEEKKAEDMTCRERILAHMQEMVKKVREGKVEPTFQTGGQTFTIKEWDKLLADFDDAQEVLQEQVKELIAEVEKQAAKEALRRAAEGKPDSDGVSATVSGVKPWEPDGMDANCTDTQVTDPEELLELLTGEVTKSTFPTDDPEHKHWFITCYGQDGISCKEAYFDGTKWVNRDCFSLSYTEPGQYEKVMAFLQRFSQDDNLRFAANENFWKDFLAGEIDEDDFVNFFETSTKDGVPDYTYEKDGSTYIDREKAKYAKYMNGFGAHFYTAQEMDLIWRGIIHENSKGLKKISDYDGQMTVPGTDEAGKNGKEKNAADEDDDLDTKIITKPDGSTVLQIETNFGVMEIEITQAQKFGLQYNARPGAGAERTQLTNPFANGMEND
ncbi:MAG: hypothetical protein HFI53_05230 [Lachnospiraceae bacterium]|nr:hypothetical protein [Lachnospiraceae bacterium]